MEQNRLTQTAVPQSLFLEESRVLEKMFEREDTKTQYDEKAISSSSCSSQASLAMVKTDDPCKSVEWDRRSTVNVINQVYYEEQRHKVSS